ncbi:energy transducer TonB [Thalassotalea sp. ND16A]|uniref:energy transducer TonB n=1 Tax=Thalassotalea sp. ND16A TaxID=1535422 RepID=UPI00051CEEA5|nr:energy transducer TonB [Thalassotalea sp. ND16A]KGJ87496.1 hypothetical protein ND16A_2879 [Thalassotalea sp. ND16A]
MKFFIPILLGALISFALFAIMASLVATEEVYLEEVEDFTIITIINEPEDSALARKNRILDPPPEHVEKPVGQFNDRTVAKAQAKLPVDMSMPKISIDNNFANQEFAVGVIKDNDAIPIYRSLPRYPVAAAQQKVRGWVKLNFSVNRWGRVEDIVIIDAEPEVIFNQAAIDALNNWKYKAKVVNGKTVSQENLSVRLDFGKKQSKHIIY